MRKLRVRSREFVEILCCPEDVERCTGAHDASELCEHCRVPVCMGCMTEILTGVGATGGGSITTTTGAGPGMLTGTLPAGTEGEGRTLSAGGAGGRDGGGELSTRWSSPNGSPA